MGKNKTSFKKGEGGRKPGSKNRTTEEMRNIIKHVIDNNLDELEDNIACLSPMNRIIAMEKLLKYIIPALSKNQNDNNNTGDLKVTVQYIDVQSINDATDKPEEKQE